MNNIAIGMTLLFFAAMTLGYGLIWVIAWLNQLFKFVMQIYKDEAAKVEPQYCYMPPIVLAISFLLWQLAEFFLK